MNPEDVQTIPVDLTGGAGSTAVKAAVAGQRWAVISAYLRCATGGASDFVVLTGTTPLTGTVPMAAAGVFQETGNPVVWVTPTAGEALNIDPGAADIDGWVNVVMLK